MWIYAFLSIPFGESSHGQDGKILENTSCKKQYLKFKETNTVKFNFTEAEYI